jgi:hypothetical protein
MSQVTAPLNLAELKQRLAAAGYTHVITLAGPLPITTWTPYGKQDDSDYQATLYPDGRAVDAPPGRLRRPSLRAGRLGVHPGGSPMKRFALRLPDDLHTWLAAYAAGQGRSINEEVLWLLRREQQRAGRREGVPDAEAQAR